MMTVYEQFNEEELLKFFYVLRTAMGGRRCCRAGNGGFGIVPASAKVGDVMVDITGGGTCFILRQIPKRRPWDKRYFTLIGDCYLNRFNAPFLPRPLTSRYFPLV